MKQLSHAIVLGGSAAGLLAARVLADYAERITLVERDSLPDAALHRKGTPQSHHANNLLPRALSALEDWFPGLACELENAGATLVTDDARTVIRGLRYARTRGAPTTLLLTRPLLDVSLLRRVRAFGKISFRTECSVTGLLLDRGKVTGVSLASNGDEMSLAGDLVVDAMGRGSQARRWLAAAGFPEPPTIEVRVGVRYASRLFSRAPDDLQGDKMVIISPTAEVPRGGVAFAVDGDRWLVTLFEYGGGAPPTDISGFCAYARTLVANDLAELVERAAAVDDGTEFSYPAARLRRFDQVGQLPDQYICLGDSLCHLNPSYGQGITSAALQAKALDQVLAGGHDSLPRPYYKLAIRAASLPFDLSWASDLDIPSVIAPPNPTPLPIRPYVRRAMRVACHDPAVALAMRRIIGHQDPPTALLRPSIAVRVLFRRGAAH